MLRQVNKKLTLFVGSTEDGNDGPTVGLTDVTIVGLDVVSFLA